MNPRDDNALEAFIVLAWILVFGFSLLCCAPTLTDVQHEASSKGVATAHAETTAKEGAATTAKTDKKSRKRTVWRRPDGTISKEEIADAGELSLVDTNNWRLLNSSIDGQVSWEDEQKDRVIKKASWWTLWRVLGAIAGIALLAGAAGFGIYRKVRRRIPI